MVRLNFEFGTFFSKKLEMGGWFSKKLEVQGVKYTVESRLGEGGLWQYR